MEHSWQIYLTIGIVMMGLEVFAPGFILFPLGVAFLITAFTALYVTSLPIQLLILALSGVLVLFLSSKFIKKDRSKTRYKSNVEGLIGKEAVVTEAIVENGSGYVKIYGDLWMALHAERKRVEPGDKVIVTGVDGNKLVVTS